MTCKDAIDLLGEFLEHALSPGDATRLEAHLAGCEPCRAYLATYRRTRELTAAEGRVEMPEEMKQRLRAFLLERLRDRPGP
jgi:anti-sigma factor (TIGR02949 family)